MNKASRRTKDNLKGVNIKLAMLAGYVLGISKVDFWVNEGLRSTETQQRYFKEGSTKCDGIKNKSNHQLGRAIDVYYVGWKRDAEDQQKWKELIDTFKLAGKQLGIKLEFGYDWGWDNPHIELADGE